MIGYLRGRVIGREPTRLLVDVNGVGYVVHVPLTVRASMGDEVALQVYTHVSNGEITLYGFEDERQRAFFEHLLKVPGVGPRMGLSLLSHLTPDELVEVIRRRDTRRLREVPGIGTKVSERVVVELTPMVGRFESSQPFPSTRSPKVASPDLSEKLREVLEALSVLGYTRREVESLAQEVLQARPTEPVEEVLRQILRRKAGR